ncbi:hypothetical protein WCE34_08610 [Luteimonas sp. MJ204]|uniref:hypothetical protein n=1 Tax=Luteimonas sp. MJ145 TaxID=3129234 RepID=UPI0031BB304B
MRTANRLYPRELYQGVFWIDNPKLVYLGMQDQYYTFNMFDAQAWVARDVILGRTALPGTDAMRADSEAWFARENACAGANDDIDFQTAYVRDLVDRTDYPEFAIEKVAEMLKEWQRDKQAGIFDYRDKSYRSTITGTLAPRHHTPWMEAMDDSLQAFLGDPRELEDQLEVEQMPVAAVAGGVGFAEPIRRRA